MNVAITNPATSVYTPAPELLDGGVASHLRIAGSAKQANEQARGRVALAMIIVSLVYCVILGRLAYFGSMELGGPSGRILADASITATRPDVLDRNGEVLATDITSLSLFAEPRRIIDPDEAVELLSTALPELNYEKIHRKLSSKAGFVWIKRELTPAKRREILGLGIPGIGFRKETKRFYPKGETASHLVGHVNIDNVGIAGLEKFLDDDGLSDLRAAGFARGEKMEPMKLSIDARVQHFVRDELEKAMVRYKAIGTGAVVLNVKTGEIVAMASLPDYDPNNPVEALKKENLNRMTAGTYEMGSTFKAFTTAMALDSGKVSLKSRFDARKPLRIAKHTINDFHAKRRILSVPEVFIYSSNIGTAKMADVVGIAGHRDFIERMGLLSKVKLQIPEVKAPYGPKKWKKINSVTISYGHGMQTTPLQTAVAGAALINGGKLIQPTLLPRTEEKAVEFTKQVIAPETSEAMRYLMRLNVERGSGRRSEVLGFRVGGKTGTAEKVVNGRYSSKVRFNAFLAAFPIDDPQYMVLTIVDEPKPAEGQRSATAGLNAAPIVSNIIRRSAAFLGVQPKFENDTGPRYVSDR